MKNVRSAIFLIVILGTSAIAQIPVKIGNVTGTVFRYNNFPSRYTTARNVDVWVPTNYNPNNKNKYAVLYIHDGQNLFNPKESVSGVDWGIDETLSRLSKDGQIKETIVVGIWSNVLRFVEFGPHKAFDIAHKKKLKSTKSINDKSAYSDRYLKFIVAELKPFIDKNYQTKSDRQNTFMMGSSMGGLMSLYALGEYPKVFGGVASLSTQLPYARGIILEYLRKFLPSPKNHKIYFDYGTYELDPKYESYQRSSDAIMNQKGYKQGENWITRKFEGEHHNERSWRKRVDIPLTFLLKK